jgi:hypothetical protein
MGKGAKPCLNFLLVHLNGKKMAVEIENNNKKNVQIMVLDKNLYIAENKLIIKESSFFYE